MLITKYLDFITFGTYNNILVSNWNYKSYLWLIFFSINLPFFLFFSTIENFIIKLKQKEASNDHY